MLKLQKKLSIKDWSSGNLVIFFGDFQYFHKTEIFYCLSPSDSFALAQKVDYSLYNPKF